ncbi:hypothetical protein Tco_0776214 [Tanacetum coccineum]
MSNLNFAETHNMVAFLEKPIECDRFEEIIDFMNASSISYVLMGSADTSPSRWEKVIVTKASLALMGYENLTQKLTFYKAFFSPQWKFLIHTVLQCLSANTTAWNEFSSTVASDVICLATNQKFNFSKYIFDNMVKNLEGGNTVTDDYECRHVVPTHSNDPLLSGEDRLILNALMELCTSLSQRVLDLEKTKTSQAVEITELKEKVKKLEKKGGSRTHRLKRLYKVGRSARVVSFEDEGLGDPEDASKQGRKIDEINQDAEVTLVDETHGRYGDNLMFDTGVLNNEQDIAEKEVDMTEKDVSTADPVTTTGEVTVNVVVSTAEVTTDSTTTTTVDELTLAQTLIEIKAAKPKARGVIVQEPSEFTTTTSPSQPSQLSQAKDKGKAKMVEPEKPLKKKDQIMFDKEVAQKLQAQLDAELEEEEKLAIQREEDANIPEWDDVCDNRQFSEL